MIIGAPKNLDEAELLSREEIEGFINNANAMLATGTPMEIPAAVPIGQLARIAATLKAYREVIRAAADEPQARQDAFILKARELVGLGQPEVAQPEVAQPEAPKASRLIIPGQNND